MAKAHTHTHDDSHTHKDEHSPLGENTVLSIVIKKADHQKAYQKVLAQYGQVAQLQGFRKGKAPLSLVESTVGPSKIIEKAVEELIPSLYEEAVKKAGIAPLVQPSISAKKLDKDADWELEASTAVAPVIKLGDYKDLVKKAGKDFVKEHEGHVHEGTPEELADIRKKELMSFVLNALIKKIEPKIPPLLLEHELNRQLEQFLRHLASHKIELDQYLKHSGKTVELIKDEYTASSLASLQVEFIIQEIVKDIDPQVEEKDIKELIGDMSKMSDKAKDRLTEEAKAVLRRRKTVEQLEKIAQS